MECILREHFPMLRSREEVLEIIFNNQKLLDIWRDWTEARQEEFLNWCTGVRGVKLLYDSFFKEVMNPEYAPERMNSLLSVLLQKEIKILKVLPNDSTRIADEHSLVIMDIVVELEDGSLANVEMQKIGYAFPGERSACYSADLLLRQYKRVRGEQGKRFRYNNIKEVYTIVFMEHSPMNFHGISDSYVHAFQQESDTGLTLDLLQKYLFIPLDIFIENYHNKGITSKLDAWLLFLTNDEPEEILRLIEQYPEFKAMYEDLYQLCLNVERVMEMFSEELRILDRNTVLYMIDEMQQEVEDRRRELEESQKELEENQKKLEENQKKLEENQKELEKNRTELEEQNRRIVLKDEEIALKDKEIQMLRQQLGL